MKRKRDTEYAPDTPFFDQAARGSDRTTLPLGDEKIPVDMRKTVIPCQSLTPFYENKVNRSARGTVTRGKPVMPQTGTQSRFGKPETYIRQRSYRLREVRTKKGKTFSYSLPKGVKGSQRTPVGETGGQICLAVKILPSIR